MHTYTEAMAFVEERKKAGIRYDLGRMERLMEKLRHAERKVKTIHVAGTNGKGSTVTFLRSILEESGLFVGTYMTPVPGDYRNQMAVNGEPMSEEEFILVLSEMAPAILEVEKEMEEFISEFELITAMAFYYFSFKKPVDIAVIETGMGGRNDATNVITPLVSIITNVSLDHQDFLGDTLEEIASEKAGIIKAGVPVMTACDPTCLPVLQGEAKQKKSSLYHLEKNVSFQTYVENGVQKMDYSTPYRNLAGVSLGIGGEHQARNAALAILTLDYMKQFYAVMVDDSHIISGLEKAKLFGRSEIFRENPTIILDTAHNPDAMARTIAFVKEMFGERKVHVLFSAMKDKDYLTMLSQLEGIADGKIYITTFASKRAISLGEFTYNSRWGVVEDAVNWAADWFALSKETENVLLITGSNQFIGEIRESLNKII